MSRVPRKSPACRHCAGVQLYPCKPAGVDCLLFGLLPMFLAMPVQNILVMLAEQAWNVGESGVGALMATGGAGGVVGALWVVKRGDDAGRMKMMLGSTIGFGICLAIFVLTPVFTLALLPLLAANVFANASQTVNNAAIQLLVDDRMRGRMSSFDALIRADPIGVFPMAIVADSFGAVSAILGASALLIAITVVFFLLSKTLRALDRSIDEAMLAELPERPLNCLLPCCSRHGDSGKDRSEVGLNSLLYRAFLGSWTADCNWWADAATAIHRPLFPTRSTELAGGDRCPYCRPSIAASSDH